MPHCGEMLSMASVGQMDWTAWQQCKDISSSSFMSKAYEMKVTLQTGRQSTYLSIWGLVAFIFITIS